MGSPKGSLSFLAPMVGCRWSVSRSFLLAAARLRGLHLDSSGAASGLAAMRKDAGVWSGPARLGKSGFKQ
jgi:hypothetical protein